MPRVPPTEDQLDQMLPEHLRNAVPVWRKWVVAGVAAGVTLAFLFALTFGAFMWYSSRVVSWNERALTVVWSQAKQRFRLDKAQVQHAGFSLNYALQNNTSRDITIRADATVMKRLSRGRTLTDYSRVANPAGAYFIPAGQRAEFSILLNYGCSEDDLVTGVQRARDPGTCFREAVDDAEGFVVFDHGQRLQVNLPKPALK